MNPSVVPGTGFQTFRSWKVTRPVVNGLASWTEYVFPDRVHVEKAVIPPDTIQIGGVGRTAKLVLGKVRVKIPPIGIEETGVNWNLYVAY